MKKDMTLRFDKETIIARFLSPGGEAVERPVEVRVHPVTGRSCRITFSRSAEKEAGADALPEPPPDALDTGSCPFCRPQLTSMTPMLPPEFDPSGRLIRGDSVLFPNLYPDGGYSAVSLFGNDHFVEIGSAHPAAYRDSFMNCSQYLGKIISLDPGAMYMAITQNHLPSAGGSLLHPHLQVHADRIASNHHRHLVKKAEENHRRTGAFLFSDYLAHEKADGSRYIGATGAWEWLAAFAPEGFFEIWGILPGVVSALDLGEGDWMDLARGVMHTQRFYRSLSRNGYNLGLLLVEGAARPLDLRVVILVRSNHAPWVRNDHTGYELMLGDMATFSSPEETATLARPFWKG